MRTRIGANEKRSSWNGQSETAYPNVSAPSASEFGAPVLFARKADGSLRFCIDYRELNAITIKDRYPLPRPDMLFDQLHGAKCFTTCDLFSGYHQSRLHPDDVHKTSFKTRFGSFEFLVLPFGLTNAPSQFMRMMHDVLKPFLDKFVVIFLDDVLIYSRSEEEHLKHIELVLEAFEKAKLRVKLSKCSFAQRSTRFLPEIILIPQQTNFMRTTCHVILLP